MKSALKMVLLWPVIYLGCYSKSAPKNAPRLSLGSDFPGFYAICKEDAEDKGAKPLQNEVTGSVGVVTDFLDTTVFKNEPIKYFGWSEMEERGKCWVVRCEYYVVNGDRQRSFSTTFLIKNGKVVKDTAIVTSTLWD